MSTNIRLAAGVVAACGLNANQPSEASFQQAAAVRVTVHLLWAAVRSFFSLRHMPLLQEIDVDKPKELVNVVLADAKQPKPHNGAGAPQPAGCWQNIPEIDKVPIYSNLTPDPNHFQDWKVCEHACAYATPPAPLLVRLLSEPKEWPRGVAHSRASSGVKLPKFRVENCEKKFATVSNSWTLCRCGKLTALFL